MGNRYLKVRGQGNKNRVSCARFCISGTNYYICIKCIQIRQLHVIVSPKVFPKKFGKDAQCPNKHKTIKGKNCSHGKSFHQYVAQFLFPRPRTFKYRFPIPIYPPNRHTVKNSDPGAPLQKLHGEMEWLRNGDVCAEAS